MEILTATTNENLKNRNSTDVFKALFTVAVEHKAAIAMWRYPNQTEKHIIVDFSEDLSIDRVDIEEIKSGFVMNSYDNEEQPNLLIKNQLYYGTKGEEILVDLSQSSAIGLNDTIENFLNDFNAKLSSSKSANASKYYNTVDNEVVGQDRDHYIAMVSNAIDAIKSSGLSKVVPSRTKAVAISQEFDVVDTFEKLCDSYENALISVVAIPNIGTWIGATPEQLISLDHDKLFRTVALAGTQRVERQQDLYEVAWRQKEIEEQAMVSRYIINCFKKIRLREFEEQGPRTARAGNMAHLKTDFIVDTVATNFPQLATVMLDLLHPTSAVCGMPKKEAQTFLKANEQHGRAYFSGYLGPVNMFNETHLYVNIRCLQLTETKAILYAGAGVTEISNPEHEWEETTLKLQTLLDVL